MRTFIPRQSSLRLSLLLLVAAAGLVAYSWWSTGLRPSQTVAQDELLDASAISRAGTSTDRAIADLQKRLADNPEDWPSYSQLGMAYLQKARDTGDPAYFGKAEGVLQRALEIEPGDYTAVCGMGVLALARHHFQEGLAWGEQARQVNPDRSYAYGIIADAQIELGLYPQAVDTIQTMVDMRPDLSSYTRASYIRELHGDTQGAIEMMQWAVDSGGAIPENAAWTRTQLGNLYFNVGKIDLAEAEYIRVLQTMPGYVYALAGLGRVRAAQGRVAEAITLLTQASQAMPVPEFVIALGELYAAAGQPLEAQKQYELVHALQKLYQANGVDLDLEIALFNADRGDDLPATIEQARQAYQRRPGIFAADVLAWALYQAGKYEEAEFYSQQALRLGTQDALKLFHAGMISLRLDQHDRALQNLEQALRTNPHFSVLYQEEARRTLEDLRSASIGNYNLSSEIPSRRLPGARGARAVR